jgi:class I fructose-bisphosphate aldolase
MGYKAVGELNGAYGKTHKLVDEKLTTDHPIDLTRYQLMNCYLGRAGSSTRRGVVGRDRPAGGRQDRGHQQARRRHGASSPGARRSNGRWQEGIELLNAIQDVYLNDDVTIA